MKFKTQPLELVIPAKAGIQLFSITCNRQGWISARHSRAGGNGMTRVIVRGACALTHQSNSTALKINPTPPTSTLLNRLHRLRKMRNRAIHILQFLQPEKAETEGGEVRWFITLQRHAGSTL